MKYVIELLSKRHVRSVFSCGEEALDVYIRNQAGQDQRRNITQVYVLCQAEQNQVLAFYTLSSSSLKVESFSEELRKQLPKYPIPTLQLGRLAVDISQKGNRLGEMVLIHAMKKTLEISQNIGVFALEVKAKHDQAAQFYLKYGFEALEEDVLRLYLPIKRIAKILEG